MLNYKNNKKKPIYSISVIITVLRNTSSYVKEIRELLSLDGCNSHHDDF